jgi:hypothetical protein
VLASISMLLAFMDSGRWIIPSHWCKSSHVWSLLMFVLTSSDGVRFFGLGVYIVSCVGTGVRRWELVISIGPNWVGFCLTTETESNLRNAVLHRKTGRWIMPEKSIILFIYHRHKLLDLVNMVRNLRIPYNAGNFLSDWATTGFSGRTQLRGVCADATQTDLSVLPPCWQNAPSM